MAAFKRTENGFQISTFTALVSVLLVIGGIVYAAGTRDAGAQAAASQTAVKVEGAATKVELEQERQQRIAADSLIIERISPIGRDVKAVLKKLCNGDELCARE